MGGFGRGKVRLRTRSAVGEDGRGRGRLWAGTAVGGGARDQGWHSRTAGDGNDLERGQRRMGTAENGDGKNGVSRCG